jgi:hypothetical protein
MPVATLRRNSVKVPAFYNFKVTHIIAESMTVGFVMPINTAVKRTVKVLESYLVYNVSLTEHSTKNHRPIATNEGGDRILARFGLPKGQPPHRCLYTEVYNNYTT